MDPVVRFRLLKAVKLIQTLMVCRMDKVKKLKAKWKTLFLHSHVNSLLKYITVCFLRTSSDKENGPKTHFFMHKTKMLENQSDFQNEFCVFQVYLVH